VITLSFVTASVLLELNHDTFRGFFYYSIRLQGFFSQVGEAAQPLIFGEKLHGNYLQKGKKKLDVNSIFGENCINLKNFSLGKQPFTGPCNRRKKSPGL
jgi:hypothetical protein